MEQHWSQEHADKETPKLRRTLFIEVIYPAFGKATVICECGARADFAVSASRPSRGRPPKPVTAGQLAEEWATQHVGQSHATNDGWELRQRYTIEKDTP
jgi:hypothetical protein